MSSESCLRLLKMKTDCVLCVRPTASCQQSSAPVDNVSCLLFVGCCCCVNENICLWYQNVCVRMW